MPIIKSAKKRVKVAAKANNRNARTKRDIRESLKAFAKALSGGKSSEITDAKNKAYSAIDKGVKKSVMHKNKAARQKATLAKQAKDAGAKPAKAAARPAKTAAKPKAAPKKAPAKKKTAAKKPAAKTRK